MWEIQKAVWRSFGRGSSDCTYSELCVWGTPQTHVLAVLARPRSWDNWLLSCFIYRRTIPRRSDILNGTMRRSVETLCDSPNKNGREVPWYSQGPTTVESAPSPIYNMPVKHLRQKLHTGSSWSVGCLSNTCMSYIGPRQALPNRIKEGTVSIRHLGWFK